MNVVRVSGRKTIPLLAVEPCGATHKPPSDATEGPLCRAPSQFGWQGERYSAFCDYGFRPIVRGVGSEQKDPCSRQPCLLACRLDSSGPTGARSRGLGKSWIACGRSVTLPLRLAR